MNLRMLLLILLSVTLSALAQVSFKVGVMALNRDSHEYWFAKIAGPMLGMLASPAVLAGFVLYVVSALLWLLVLARVDVSVAYPFVGIGFVITMLLGWLYLGEAITVVRVVGTILVCAGVTLVAVSQA